METSRPPTRCACGYDFRTGDISVAIEALVPLRRTAVRRAMLGVAMMLGGILAIAATHGAYGVLTVLYAAVLMLGGAALMVHGVPRAFGLTRRMREARLLAKLPQARLLGAPRP